MITGILGKKVGMSQIFDDKGTVIPVTLVEAGPCPVVNKKIHEKDGYNSLQLGFHEEKKAQRITKPQQGYFEKRGIKPTRFLQEIRLDAPSDLEVGGVVTVESFTIGDKVNVTGTSKGKGFTGGVKRWGYRGGPESHGSMFHRAPGSIGASSYPSRVTKGKHLPGRMGGAKVTIRNLFVFKIYPERNLMLIKGAIPGPPGGLLVIQKKMV